MKKHSEGIYFLFFFPSFLHSPVLLINTILTASLLKFLKTIIETSVSLGL